MSSAHPAGTVPVWRRILIAVDDSAFGEVVLRNGLAIAQQRGAEAHVVHVVASVSAREKAVALRSTGQDAGDVTSRVQAEVLRRAGETAPYPPPVVHVQRGVPAVVITELAADVDADLIVVGSRGTRTVDHALFGSVSERVLRWAPCPVLVIRPKTTASTASQPDGVEQAALQSREGV